MPRRLTCNLMLSLYVLAAGLLFVGAFVLGDVPGWWDPEGFIVNVISTFVTACLAVPTAFFLLRPIIDREDDRRARRNIIRQTQSSLRDIEIRLAKYYRSPEHLDSKADQMNLAIEALFDLAEKVKASGSGDSKLRTTEVARVDDLVSLVRGQVTFDSLQPRVVYSDWAIVRSRWSTLSTRLLPEARSYGLELIQDRIESEVHRFMNDKTGVLAKAKAYGWSRTTLPRDAFEKGGALQDEQAFVWQLPREVEGISAALISGAQSMHEVRMEYKDLSMIFHFVQLTLSEIESHS